MRSYLNFNPAAELRMRAAERRGGARGPMPAITNADHFSFDGHARFGGPCHRCRFIRGSCAAVIFRCPSCLRPQPLASWLSMRKHAVNH